MPRPRTRATPAREAAGEPDAHAPNVAHPTPQTRHGADGGGAHGEHPRGHATRRAPDDPPDPERDRDARAPRDAPKPPDPLDPLYRHALVAPAPAVEVPAARARTSLEEILPAVVRRIAWSGDGRKGAVRIELGAGALAGATLLLEADDGRVRVRLDAPPGVDARAWRDRIAARFAARRIAVDAFEVE